MRPPANPAAASRELALAPAPARASATKKAHFRGLLTGILQLQSDVLGPLNSASTVGFHPGGEVL